MHLAVMSTLVVIALPLYTKYVARSRQQEAKAQASWLSGQAQEIYKLQYGSLLPRCHGPFRMEGYGGKVCHGAYRGLGQHVFCISDGPT